VTLEVIFQIRRFKDLFSHLCHKVHHQLSNTAVFRVFMIEVLLEHFELSHLVDEVIDVANLNFVLFLVVTWHLVRSYR
jgi:hypothetical protein